MYVHFFKRLIDILIGLCALPFVVLVILVFGPIIYFTDKGPVFYNATRAGKDYKPFKMFKLRSMYVNSPDLKNPDGSTYNSDHDPRVTPIGRFLRKTSLDEFPQFLNVLIGDISFIGPRPLYVNFLKLYDETQARRHEVRPGISGWAQVHGRNLCTYSKKFEYDVWYVDHISAWVDLQILFLTIKNVVCREDIGVGSGNNDEVDDLGFTQRLKDMGLREE